MICSISPAFQLTRCDKTMIGPKYHRCMVSPFLNPLSHQIIASEEGEGINALRCLLESRLRVSQASCTLTSVISSCYMGRKQYDSYWDICVQAVTTLYNLAWWICGMQQQLQRMDYCTCCWCFDSTLSESRPPIRSLNQEQSQWACHPNMTISKSAIGLLRCLWSLLSVL